MCTAMSWQLRVTIVLRCSTASGLMPSKVTFTAGSSVFTNEMQLHETCGENQDTHTAASGHVR
jgi:hypothetical protein